MERFLSKAYEAVVSWMKQPATNRVDGWRSAMRTPSSAVAHDGQPGIETAPRSPELDSELAVRRGPSDDELLCRDDTSFPSLDLNQSRPLRFIPCALDRFIEACVRFVRCRVPRKGGPRAQGRS
jgi:hypothetical protein